MELKVMNVVVTVVVIGLNVIDVLIGSHNADKNKYSVKSLNITCRD